MKSFMENSLTDACPIPSPLRGKLGIVLFLSWLFLISFIARTIFSPLMPAIEQEMQIGHGQAGRLFLMISFGYLIVPFVSGWMTSRINHRGALAVSAWIVGLSLIPFAFIQELWLLQIFMVTLGLGAGLHLPSAMATIAAEVQKSDWGKALSIHQCIPPLSFICAPLIAALLIMWVPWRSVIMIWAAIALLSAMVYSIKGRGGDFAGRRLNLEHVKSVVSLPGFWIMLLLLAMGIGGNAGIYAMLPLFFVNERGMDLPYANTLIGLSLISGVFAVFIAGWVIDKIGQKATMIYILLTAAVCTIFLGIAERPLILVLLFLQSAALSAFFPAAFGALARVAPPSLRSVSTALGPPTSFVVGAGIVPAFIGLLGDVYTFSTGIISVGCFMLIGPALVGFLKLGQFDDQPGC